MDRKRYVTPGPGRSRRDVGVVDRVRTLGDLHRKVEHRPLARLQVGLPRVSRDLIGNERVLRPDAQDRAVRDDAILALVDAGGRDHDHLPLGLRQAARLLHERVMVGEEGAELVGPARQRKEDVRHEAGLLLHRGDARGDVGRKLFERRRPEPADKRLQRIAPVLLSLFARIRACQAHSPGAQYDWEMQF
jgi:hypothetical protein